MINARFVCIAFLLSTATLHAHHIWILPEAGGSARAIFSDTLKPDSPRTLDNIGHTRLWLRDAEGQETQLAWKREENSYAIQLKQPRPQAIGGECIYGTEVHDHRLRMDVQPYLLVYYPKTLLAVSGIGKPWPKLNLEIVPVTTAQGVRLQVLFKSKPAAKAEMIVFCPDGERHNLVSSPDGLIDVPLKVGGLYAFRTRVLEDIVGTHEGKKYWEIRHYASLVMELPAVKADLSGER